MIIMTSIKLLQKMWLLQEMMNLVMQFVRIMHHVFEKLTLHICNQFLDDIEVKELKTDYKREKVLSDIQQFILKHIQNINKVLCDVKHVEITVAEEKSQWLMTEVKIVEFVYDHKRHHLNQTKILKIIKWSFYKNLKKIWVFINVCMYYCI